MSQISSETLFNFTDNLEYLINNLREGIYCSSIYEKLPIKDSGYRVAMCCFCDIPLSLIQEHFDWYGKYAIGIKRSYARELGVKPVWYVTSENNLVKNLVKAKNLTDYERNYLLPYLKQFIGNQKYKEEGEKRKKFYNEREWRYISKNSKVETFFKTNRKNVPIETNDKYERMPIDLMSIEYIILEKESDIEEILKVFKDLSKNQNIKYENLVSKLITAKQIIRDF